MIPVYINNYYTTETYSAFLSINIIGSYYSSVDQPHLKILSLSLSLSLPLSVYIYIYRSFGSKPLYTHSFQTINEQY